MHFLASYPDLQLDSDTLEKLIEWAEREGRGNEKIKVSARESIQRWLSVTNDQCLSPIDLALFTGRTSFLKLIEKYGDFNNSLDLNNAASLAVYMSKLTSLSERKISVSEVMKSHMSPVILQDAINNYEIALALPMQREKKLDQEIETAIYFKPNFDDDKNHYTQLMKELFAQLEKRFNNRDKYRTKLFGLFGVGYSREDKLVCILKLINVLLSKDRRAPSFSEKEIACLTQGTTGKY